MTFARIHHHKLPENRYKTTGCVFRRADYLLRGKCANAKLWKKTNRGVYGPREIAKSPGEAIFLQIQATQIGTIALIIHAINSRSNH